MTTLRTNALIIMIGAFLSISAAAQTTEITYQGHLQNGGSAATGNFDFEFRLFDAVSGGGQVGPLLTRTNVAVTNGIFAVKLDFGSVFPGADRFLEIQVRPAGGGAYTLLDPRERTYSAPYAIKSVSSETATNALQLGGVAANQYVVTADPRLSDARSPTAGSPNYIQNTLALQAGSNFNVSGNGTVGGILSGNVVNAGQQVRIGGSTVLRLVSAGFFGSTILGFGAGLPTTGGANSFFGEYAGNITAGGVENSFFGTQAGSLNVSGGANAFFGYLSGANTTVSNNSFFGTRSGRDNTTGTRNSFFGSRAGEFNNSSSDNSFFGASAGINTTGFQNSFFGSQAGGASSSGGNNVFVGYRSGSANTDGSDNVFVGSSSGEANSIGNNNTFVGKSAGFFNSTGSNNSFVGFQAGGVNNTGQSGTFMGYQAGLGNTTGQNNTFVGRSAGAANTVSGSNAYFGSSSGLASTGNENTFIGFGAGVTNTGGDRNTFIGKTSGTSNTTGNDNTAIGKDTSFASGGLSFATVIGAGAQASLSNSIYLGRADGSDTVRIPGGLLVGSMGATTGNVHLCLNSGNRLSACTSNLAEGSEVEKLRQEVAEQKMLIAALKDILCSTNKEPAICREEKLR